MKEAINHPETGQPLIRETRSRTMTYKGELETYEMPGWHLEDDPTLEQGVFDPKEMQVRDRV